ncbi:GNAT family N-acetyltransferase [Paenibacillus mendelii]|uniref:GNAT family N-acetyltransferase n=1 Tax=Paenibacillus mendelii TaxID=206163 RepID=A0ABV6JMJ0_9BACL|nr:GNAT family N-acetyltransferase [Paenibacillus mendelii]MCQ6558955.1 bifunctional GNAT family N-acetyltransferase/NUDIX hydrolase [Paenibacillus mendelii]
MHSEQLKSIRIEPFVEAYVPQMHQLQQIWAFENITYGVVTDDIADLTAAITPYCYIALNGDTVIGYLTASVVEANEMNIFPRGGSFIRVDDVYILREFRSLGIGRQLLARCEQQAVQDGMNHFMVSSATKDAETVRKFYMNNGYHIWTTHFFKRIGSVNIEYPVGELDNIRYVAVYTKHNGQWVLCFHKKRQTWECPGGHVEMGEDALTAAKRELREETGASLYTLTPLWDYSHYGETHSNNGRVFFADVEAFGDLPSHEMDRIGFFDDLPGNVTYDRSAMLNNLARVEKYMQAHGNLSRPLQG